MTAVGIGPICRLDVDGPAHRPAGRSHKHSMQTDRCPDRNYDLDAPLRHEQHVTVYDDRHDVYRPEDLERIKDLSELIALSARQDLVALLAA